MIYHKKKNYYIIKEGIYQDFKKYCNKFGHKFYKDSYVVEIKNKTIIYTEDTNLMRSF